MRIYQTFYPFSALSLCTAAGYVDLYKELCLLPDVSIAEEARENTDGGNRILRTVKASPMGYTAMDDFTSSVNTKSSYVVDRV